MSEENVMVNEDRKGGWILTYGGRQFWPEDPRPEDVHIEDIAHALSNLCRFTGHCVRFYSVAEHSIRVAEQVPRKFKPWALLHDAAEAYVNDVAAPLKRSRALQSYRDIEDCILWAVLTRFGLQPHGLATPWIPPDVKVADVRMLMTERRDLMPPDGPDWELNVEPFTDTIPATYYANVAKTEFLVAAKVLGLD